MDVGILQEEDYIMLENPDIKNSAYGRLLDFWNDLKNNENGFINLDEHKKPIYFYQGELKDQLIEFKTINHLSERRIILRFLQPFYHTTIEFHSFDPSIISLLKTSFKIISTKQQRDFLEKQEYLLKKLKEVNIYKQDISIIANTIPDKGNLRKVMMGYDYGYFIQYVIKDKDETKALIETINNKVVEIDLKSFEFLT